MKISFSSIYKQHYSTPHDNYHSNHLGKDRGKNSINQTVTQGIGQKISENNYRPAKRVSFSGSAVSKIPKWADNLARNKKFTNLVDKVGINEALFEATFVLGLTAVLKPICVINMPGAKKKNKETVATKNFVSALLGFILSCIILNPISAMVNRALGDKAKYNISKEGIKKMAENGNYAEAFKTFFKKSPEFIIAPAKAAITIALMPKVMNFLFGDKKGKKKEQQPKEPAVIIMMKKYDDAFKNIAEGTL